MRTAFLIAVSTVAGLGACAPLPSDGYGYGVVAQPAPGYGYYDGGYAPAPYYAEPVYGTPYVSPGPAIIIGGERRYNDRYREDRYREERFRNERPRYDGGYRGNPNQGRDGRQPGPQNFGGGGGGRPAPAPAAINRPPPPQAQPQAPHPGGPPPGNGGSPFGPSNPQGERG